jgi:integrase
VVPEGKQRLRVAKGIYLKRSGKYLAEFRDPGRKQHWKEFTTLRAAELWRAEALRDPSTLRSGRRSLEQVWNDFLDHHGSTLRPTTRANWEQQWRTHIGPELGSWPIGRIDVKDVKDWMVRLERRGIGAATRNKCRSILHRLFEEAIENKEVPAFANPVVPGTKVRSSQPKKARILMPDEVGRVLAAARRSSEHDGEVDALAIEMLFFLGLRIGEMGALQAIDVDLKRHQLDVRRTLVDVSGHVSVQDATKTNRPRVLALPEELPVTQHLTSYIKTRGLVGAVQLFTAPQGRFIHPNNWRRRVWKRAMDQAGIVDPPTPHSGRRTTASLLQIAGVPPVTIQAILGHSTLQQTGEYIDVPRTEMEAGFRKLAVLLGST